MEYIAKYEQHPDPTECGGVDFAAIYSSLGHLMQGGVPPDLNPQTALMMQDTLEKFNSYTTRVGASMNLKPIQLPVPSPSLSSAERSKMKTRGSLKVDPEIAGTQIASRLASMTPAECRDELNKPEWSIQNEQQEPETDQETAFVENP